MSRKRQHLSNERSGTNNPLADQSFQPYSGSSQDLVESFDSADVLPAEVEPELHVANRQNVFLSSAESLSGEPFENTTHQIGEFINFPHHGHNIHQATIQSLTSAKRKAPSTPDPSPPLLRPSSTLPQPAPPIPTVQPFVQAPFQTLYQMLPVSRSSDSYSNSPFPTSMGYPSTSLNTLGNGFQGSDRDWNSSSNLPPGLVSRRAVPVPVHYQLMPMQTTPLIWNSVVNPYIYQVPPQAERSDSNSSKESRTKRKKYKTASKYRGVSWHKRDRKWLARLWIGKRVQYIGAFVDELEAALAVDEAAISAFGPTADRLNFPDPERRAELRAELDEKARRRAARQQSSLPDIDNIESDGTNTLDLTNKDSADLDNSSAQQK